MYVVTKSSHDMTLHYSRHPLTASCDVMRSLFLLMSSVILVLFFFDFTSPPVAFTIYM